MEMPGGVLVLGRIAAADMSALEAEPQMDPTITGLDALRANVKVGMSNFD